MHTTSRIALACASILALSTFSVLSAAAQPPETVVEPEDHEGHLVEADDVADEGEPDQAAPPAHDHDASHAAHAASAAGAGGGAAGGGGAAAGGAPGGSAPVVTTATAATAEPTPETAPLGSSGVGGTGGNGRPVEDPDNPR